MALFVLVVWPKVVDESRITGIVGISDGGMKR